MIRMNALPTEAAPPQLDDAALAARVRAGDAAAFELVMRRHNRRLYRVARAMLRDAAEAEDALQDAYLAAFQAIGRFRGEASLATWLSRVVVNQCLGRLRRQARRDNIVPMVSMDGAEDQEHFAMPSDASETPDQAFVRSELREVLERKLDELPEAFRVVFVLRCVEELSVEETAQCLAIPEATVRTRHFRARSMLREALAQEIDGAERELFSFGGAHCDRIVAAVLRRLREGGNNDPGTPPAGNSGPA
jgi:RNA polymerase sigma-70 factor (ECF subfamily)